MAEKYYQLPYDSEIDKDIADWLNGLPRARKGELVRNAIRFYLQATQGDTIITTNTSHIPLQAQKDEEPEKPKKRPKLPTDGDFS